MLTNRIALITGAANGIGESIARIFAQYEAFVAVSDLNENSCHEVVKILKNSEKHMGIEVDVTNKKSITNAIEKMKEKFGKPPDIVVNSAGIINRVSLRFELYLDLL